MRPLELSARLIELYNARDLAGMVGLFADDVEFIRPGPERVTGRTEVAARYEKDWQIFEASSVEIVRALADGPEVAAEIRMTLQREGETLQAGGAVFHRWEHGLLRRYRAYLDLPPF